MARFLAVQRAKHYGEKATNMTKLGSSLGLLQLVRPNLTATSSPLIFRNALNVGLNASSRQLLNVSYHSHHNVYETIDIMIKGINKTARLNLSGWDRRHIGFPNRTTRTLADSQKAGYLPAHDKSLSLKKQFMCNNAAKVKSCLWHKVISRSARPVTALHPLNNQGIHRTLYHGKDKYMEGYTNMLQNKAQLKFLKKEVKLLHTLFATHLNHAPGLLRCSTGGQRNFSTTPQTKQQDQDDKEDKKDNERVPKASIVAMMVWFGVIAYLVLQLLSEDPYAQPSSYISWNEFANELLAKGEVAEIVVHPDVEVAEIKLHPGAVILGRQANTGVYFMKIPELHKFEEKVMKLEEDLGIKPGRGVPISYRRTNVLISYIFMAIVAAAFFMIFRNVVSFKMPSTTNMKDIMTGNMDKAKYVLADQVNQGSKKITFKDVAGLHEAKIEVMEFVDYLKNPQRYKELGARIPHGALLTGPPGCGKTLLAKAVASESNVPFLAMAGTDFVEIIGGLGASRVRDLFKEAKKKAPCLIYIDEIDAVARHRSGSDRVEGSGEEEHTLNQLLVEMDGMMTTDGVIVLASTNRADVLDKAILRPGRFDRHINIDLPTLAERRETFQMYLEKLKLAKAANTYVERLAQLSPGMSGADIANICNEAALHAARVNKKRVDEDDFEYAVERVVAGAAKKSRVLSPQEKKIVAYHEAGHALVGWLLEHTDAMLKVSIVPRTSNVLGFAQYMPSDFKLHSKEELFDKMCMALGGRVAESITFNSVTSGAQDDLRKVTKMAYQQIQQLGMNDKIGLISFNVDGDGFGPKPYSKHLSRLIDEEARNMVAKAYQTTEKILKENKEKLRMVAEELVEKETISYQDMEQLVGPPKYGRKTFPSQDWSGQKPAEPSPAV